MSIYGVTLTSLTGRVGFKNPQRKVQTEGKTWECLTRLHSLQCWLPPARPFIFFCGFPERRHVVESTARAQRLEGSSNHRRVPTPELAETFGYSSVYKPAAAAKFTIVKTVLSAVVFPLAQGACRRHPLCHDLRCGAHALFPSSLILKLVSAVFLRQPARGRAAIWVRFALTEVVSVTCRMD